MKYYSKTEYVNINTGEILSKSEVERNKMIKKRSHKQYKKLNDDTIEINWLTEVEENRQTELKF